MPSGFNSAHDIGIRRVTAQGIRNFELNGAQLYVALHAKGIDHGGNHYAKGSTIAYDAAGGTAYTDYRTMERDFNRQAIDPAD